MIKKGTKTSTTTDINDKRNVESKEITLENRTPFYKRILRLAAKSEEQSLSLSSQPSLGSNLRQSLFSSLKLPSVLAITMVILGLVPPAPILVSVFISGCLYLLSMLAAARLLHPPLHLICKPHLHHKDTFLLLYQILLEHNGLSQQLMIDGFDLEYCWASFVPQYLRHIMFTYKTLLLDRWWDLMCLCFVYKLSLNDTFE